MGTCKTFFTIVKSEFFQLFLIYTLLGFLGTGLLLQAKGFSNGGWAFSSCVLLISAILAAYCA